MQTKEASLLRQWRLLSDEVVPRLSARRTPGCPSVWADGDVSDAVAVSLAYRHARPGRTRDLAVFATPASGEPSGVWYSMSDIRTLPAAVLREGLCRGARGWMPAPGVAEQVQLGRPNRPVDLLVVRGCHTGSRRRGHPGALLRPGGYLLLLGDGEPELASDPHLETVPGTPLLRRKKGSGGPPGQVGPPDPQVEVRTLAQKLLEEEMVARHLNLARGLARRFSGHGEPLEDLRQVAFVGLVLAARRYDPAQNASFSTYATATILGELKRYFRDKSWMMRVPRQVQETYLAIKTAREELYQELACSPTIGQIARRLRISEEAVLEAIEAGDNFMPQSLDVGPDGDSTGRDVPVVDPAFDVVLERSLLMDAIPRLSKKEQLVLKRVYLDGWTQRRVAQEIGVSQMQVSRLLNASGHKIRSWTGS